MAAVGAENATLLLVSVATRVITASAQVRGAVMVVLRFTLAFTTRAPSAPVPGSTMMLTAEDEGMALEEDTAALLDGADDDAADEAVPLEPMTEEDTATEVLPAKLVAVEDGGSVEEDTTGPEEDPTTAELLPRDAEDPLPGDDAPDEEAPTDVATDVPMEALDPLLLLLMLLVPPPDVLTVPVEDVVTTMLVPDPELREDAVDAEDAALEPLPALVLPMLTAPLLLPLSNSSTQKPCSSQP